MDTSDDPKVSQSSKLPSFEILLAVAAMIYEKEFGTNEEDKPKIIDEETEIEEARISGDTVPRKKRTQRSSSSRKMVTPWTRVIEQQRSELQNPNAESEPSSSSSCVTEFKKHRPINMEETSRKKIKIVRPLEVEPIQSIPPEWLLNVMRREKNGYNPKLISTRKLFMTDVDKVQSRLSVPFKQVKNPDFLTEEETRILDEYAMKIRKTGVSVNLVDPMMNKHVLDLRKWKVGANWMYALCDGWNNVVAANSFKFDDFFPLWSFRSGSGKLCFALVPPTPTNPTNPSHGCSSTSGESGLGNSLPAGGDDGASTSGECNHGCSSFDDSTPL